MTGKSYKFNGIFYVKDREVIKLSFTGDENPCMEDDEK